MDRRRMMMGVVLMVAGFAIAVAAVTRDDAWGLGALVGVGAGLVGASMTDPFAPARR